MAGRARFKTTNTTPGESTTSVAPCSNLNGVGNDDSSNFYNLTTAVGGGGDNPYNDSSTAYGNGTSSYSNQGGYNSGGGNDRRCHKCQETGHMSRDCPNASSRGGGGVCFKCNESGHMARECPNAPSGGDRTCHKCNETGHMARECPNAPSGGDRTCHKCNETGHMARECPNAPSGGDRTCHKCNETGHIARECPNAPPPEEGAGGVKLATFRPPDVDINEMANFMTQGHDLESCKDIEVRIIGNNPPAKINTWEEAQLPDSLFRNVVKTKYPYPLPIQRASIPVVTSGRDLIAIAPTGQGKTAAFLLPIMSTLLKSGDYKKNEPPADTSEGYMITKAPQPRALIIAPTRELATQTYNHGKVLSEGTGLTVSYSYGGVQVMFSRQQLMAGCDILAATPGRLIDFLDKEWLSLEKCQYLVLDEADKLLDAGSFEPAISKVVEKFQALGRKPHVLMVSATFPESVNELAKRFLDPNHIRLEVGLIGAANSGVTQTVYQVNSRDKERKLEEIMETLKEKKVLVFAEKKAMADFLGLMYAQKFKDVTYVLTLHGDRTQEQRHRTMDDFRRHSRAILFATSVAARGLDIPLVNVVINYDMPKEITEYVHRIGRTARAGTRGESITFFDTRQDAAHADGLVNIMASTQQVIPDWLQALGGGGGGFGGGGFSNGFSGGDSGLPSSDMGFGGFEGMTGFAGFG